MDTTEPETEGQEENILLHHKLATGSGDRYVNLYPLMTTRAYIRGSAVRRTRSAFTFCPVPHLPGAQRNARDSMVGRH